jgi:hypothetical protein
MTEQEFRSAMTRARIEAAHGQRPDYWQGYTRGLRRGYHGEAFGTQAEHDLWLTLASSQDALQAQRGEGYRDGYAAAGGVL